MTYSSPGSRTFLIVLISILSVLLIALCAIAILWQPQNPTIPSTGDDVTVTFSPPFPTAPTTPATTNSPLVPTTTTSPIIPTTTAKPTTPTTEPTKPTEPDNSVFNTENVACITFYAYYGGGKGSEVPAENMAEIIHWLDSFTVGEKAPDILPPGTNTYYVEIQYADGTVIKTGLDTVTVDGTTYYLNKEAQPDCFTEIISKTEPSDPPHEHVYGTQWQSDENNHWKECECGETAHSDAHADTDLDEKCDVCSAYVPLPIHNHAYGTEWKFDDNSHWKECECGETAHSDAHVDLNTDGKCDVCASTLKAPFDEQKFFSESAFIGDSVTLALRNYCLTDPNALHGAKILCAGSYAVRHAIDKVGGTDVVSITYQGQKMRPEDALAAAGVKRVFIMLGLNDIAFGIDWTIQNWGTLVKNIRSKCPDIEIYIQSGTPIWIGGEIGALNNANMEKYNVKLQQFCKDNNCYFVNVAEALKNDQGGLRTEYCSDKYVHLTPAGVKAWIAYLKAYAAANHS